jgi:hypothetical protein
VHSSTPATRRRPVVLLMVWIFAVWILRRHASPGGDRRAAGSAPSRCTQGLQSDQCTPWHQAGRVSAGHQPHSNPHTALRCKRQSLPGGSRPATARTYRPLEGRPLLARGHLAVALRLVVLDQRRPGALLSLEELGEGRAGRWLPSGTWRRMAETGQAAVDGQASRIVSAVQRGASSCLSWLCWPHEPGEPDREAGREAARFRRATPRMSRHP